MASGCGESNNFYGKKHSEESLAKMRASHRKNRPDVTVPCSCGCGELVSLGHRDKTLPKHFVNREHMGRAQQGENNPAWRGGGGRSYGPCWKSLKSRVRDRDKICQQCGKTPESNGRLLDVHHIEAYRINQNNSLDNLVALCRECHRKITTAERRTVPIKPRVVSIVCWQCGEEFTAANYYRKLCPSCYN